MSTEMFLTIALAVMLYYALAPKKQDEGGE
jgi:hypothetical protein